MVNWSCSLHISRAHCIAQRLTLQLCIQPPSTSTTELANFNRQAYIYRSVYVLAISLSAKFYVTFRMRGTNNTTPWITMCYCIVFWRGPCKDLTGGGQLVPFSPYITLYWNGITKYISDYISGESTLHLQGETTLVNSHPGPIWHRGWLWLTLWPHLSNSHRAQEPGLHIHPRESMCSFVHMSVFFWCFFFLFFSLLVQRLACEKVFVFVVKPCQTPEPPLGRSCTVTSPGIWNLMLDVGQPEWLGGPTTLVVLQFGSSVPFVTPGADPRPQQSGRTEQLQLCHWPLDLSVGVWVAPMGPTDLSVFTDSSGSLKSAYLQCEIIRAPHTPGGTCINVEQWRSL